MTRLTTPIAAIVLVLMGIFSILPTLALAQAPDAVPAVATTAEAPAPVKDMGQMLATCDARLEQCIEHRAGMPYLAAAYIVLWVLTLVFIFVWRRGQRGLLAEVAELRARLRDLEDDA